MITNYYKHLVTIGFHLIMNSADNGYFHVGRKRMHRFTLSLASGTAGIYNITAKNGQWWSNGDVTMTHFAIEAVED